MTSSSSQPSSAAPSPEARPRAERVYEGQFGTFTIDAHDRKEVIGYRLGLGIAATSVALSVLTLFVASAIAPWVATIGYGLMWLGLGLSLFKIHIYMRPLHRALQFFWAVGGLASVAIALRYPEPLALTCYQYPLTIFGVGFTFAALTGIFIKEAFCFNRLEAKFLAFIVPALLLGHLTGVLSPTAERSMLAAWAVLFVIFALRKAFQAIPPDIGDKSVFEHLAKTRQQAA